jgi:malic enzyme
LSPNIIVHWEDFKSKTAYQNLQKAKKHLISFNDDLEGTAMVAIATIIAALNKKQ